MMSGEEIQVAIAEACGWSQIRNANTMACGGIWVGYPPMGALIGKPSRLPDFTHDLNAMHEVEMMFEPKHVSDLDRQDRLELYYAHLDMLCVGHFGGARRATAGQRAEAFVRTIAM